MGLLFSAIVNSEEAMSVLRSLSPTAFERFIRALETYMQTKAILLWRLFSRLRLESSGSGPRPRQVKSVMTDSGSARFAADI